MKQNLRALKGEMDKSIIISGDRNFPFSTIVRTVKQKICKDTEKMNTINQQDLVNIEKFYLTTEKYTFLSIH
jgi:hypothetical protein